MISVSVIIATHNQEKYIDQAVDSVLSQSYKDAELFIVNDGSTDNTGEIVKKYNYVGAKIINTPDVGPIRSRMTGVKASRGKYLLFLDGDDEIDPLFLEKTHDVLESNPQYSFCYTDTKLFGAVNSAWIQPEYNFHDLLLNNYICYCSLMKRNDFLKSGYVPNHYGYYEDYGIWINMGRLGMYGIHIPEKLFYYRVHSESSSQSERDKVFGLAYKAHIVVNYPELFDRSWLPQAKAILAQYPSDFMMMNHKQQEKYLTK